MKFKYRIADKFLVAHYRRLKMQNERAKDPREINVHTLEDYQDWVRACTFGVDHNDLTYPTMALGGEVGEVQNVVKKMIRDGDMNDTARRDMIRDELGDVIHYFMRMCIALDVSAEKVIMGNVDKINARFETGAFPSNDFR